MKWSDFLARRSSVDGSRWKSADALFRRAKQRRVIRAGDQRASSEIPTGARGGGVERVRRFTYDDCDSISREGGVGAPGDVSCANFPFLGRSLPREEASSLEAASGGDPAMNGWRC